MKNAQSRNMKFAQLVCDTKNTPFGQRLLELTAFANGAGCRFKFDSDGWELWSMSGWGGRRLYRVYREG